MRFVLRLENRERFLGIPEGTLISLTPGIALPDPKPALRATKVNYRDGWIPVLRRQARQWRGCAGSSHSSGGGLRLDLRLDGASFFANMQATD